MVVYVAHYLTRKKTRKLALPRRRNFEWTTTIHFASVQKIVVSNEGSLSSFGDVREKSTGVN